MSCVELFRRVFGVLFSLLDLAFKNCSYMFLSVRGQKGHFMSKVKKRRNLEIDSSASAGKWSEVSRLLDQPFQNLERKGRKYGLSSLNSLTVTEGKTTELIDFIDDDTYNPEKNLLRKERSEYLDKALQKLSEDDLHIFLEVALKGTSALQLTKETSYKSHKTIQRHYEKAVLFLQKELKDYF